MIDTTLIGDWNKEHFITYICLCVAASDMEIDDSELDEIKNKVQEFLGEDMMYDSLLEEVLNELKNHTVKDKEDVINMNKNRFFKSAKDREKIIDMVEDVIVADLNIEQSELKLYKMIKNALKE